MNIEKKHWLNVLKKIIACVKFLVDRNDAYQSTRFKLYREHNGTFLGIIQMVAKFD